MKRIELLVLDIDGTLADPSQRQHLVKSIEALYGAPPSQGNIEKIRSLWDDFYLRCEADAVIDGSRDCVDALVSRSTQYVYLTGRSAVCRDMTESWLYKHGFPSAPILMRSETDNRASVHVKSEHLNKLRLEYAIEPDVVLIDDEPAILEMAYRLGAEVHSAPHCWSYLPKIIR